MNQNNEIAPLNRFQLDYLPVGLFGAVMGLTGLSVAWQLAHAYFGGPAWLSMISSAIGLAAIAAFVAIFVGYTIKVLTAFDLVVAEFRHPISGNLFGTPIISALLLPILLAPHSLILAQLLWAASAIGMTLFSWIIINRWLSDRQQVAHAAPAWIIPVVGLLDLPLALPGLGFPPMHGLMVFALSVGMFFTMPLFTLVLSRLLFEPPLPDALKPSLLILVAPFSVGYSTYVVTVGQTDVFAQSLYMLAIFLLAALLGQLRNVPVCCPFRVSWWAVSFPLAASAVASIRFASSEPGLIANAMALGLLALATAVIMFLFGRTLLGLIKGELRALST